MSKDPKVRVSLSLCSDSAPAPGLLQLSGGRGAEGGERDTTALLSLWFGGRKDRWVPDGGGCLGRGTCAHLQTAPLPLSLCV